MTYRSDIPEGRCINGCLQADVHYADCKSYDPVDPIVCPGCAPVETVDGTLICDRCYRRVRFLLHSAADILGRMRSLAQQGKAVVYSAASGGSTSATAPDQVDADLLEATDVVGRKLRGWRPWISAGRQVLDAALSDPDTAAPLLADILEQHTPIEYADEWSLADAHARWGTERRDRFVYPDEEEPAGLVVVSPVREWYDPLLAARDAAERAGISEQQLRVWVKREIILPVAKIREPGVLRFASGRPSPGKTVSWFRASDVDSARERMDQERERGRFKAAAT
ncbi:hypothetical protein ACLBWJ_13125 [Microbacterium sp. M4A5_1d]